MIAWLAAVLLAVAPAPAPVSGLAGNYRTHQMEVGAQLELNDDGTFRYMLDYGNVSEASEGHWTAAKGVVHLNSDPLAKELLMEIERSDAAFKDEQLLLDDGALMMRRHETIFKFSRDEP
jgi:hypothetical protein